MPDGLRTRAHQLHQVAAAQHFAVVLQGVAADGGVGLHDGFVNVQGDKLGHRHLAGGVVHGAKISPAARVDAVKLAEAIVCNAQADRNVEACLRHGEQRKTQRAG